MSRFILALRFWNHVMTCLDEGEAIISHQQSKRANYLAHLSVGESQAGCNFIAIGWRQVLLVKEALLELEDLVVGKCGARLALLLLLWPRREQIDG
jgi:hypothetical protein